MKKVSPFLLWLRGEKDPYLNNVEMKDHPEAVKVSKPETKISDDIFSISKNKVLSKSQKAYYGVAIVCLVAVAAIMIYAMNGLPQIGNALNPVNNEVSRRYIEQGLKETNSVNIVTGMILDYRAFDTLGESHVLFLGTCAVLCLLKASKTREIYEGEPNVLLQSVSKILVPIIAVFGIYVILCGHLGPGGGFSGGTIIGAALILYANAYGFEKASKFFTGKTHIALSVGALGTYSLCKTYSFYTGANHIHSIIPMGITGNILSSGLILILNICVGIVVAATMYTIYVYFRKGGF